MENQVSINILFIARSILFLCLRNINQLCPETMFLVSFQEIDDGLSSANNRELPGMLRRGSIAPLAARIRAKRPPTAPPGSIYRTDYDGRLVTIYYIITPQ